MAPAAGGSSGLPQFRTQPIELIEAGETHGQAAAARTRYDAKRHRHAKAFGQLELQRVDIGIIGGCGAGDAE